VISSCISDPNIQSVVRIRLQAMFRFIGLGNVKETLALVEHVWELPFPDRSPWTIFKVMQAQNIWISFA